MRNTLENLINDLSKGELIAAKEYHLGVQLYQQEKTLMLAQSQTRFDILVEGEQEVEIMLLFGDGIFVPQIGKRKRKWDRYSVAALLELQDALKWEPVEDLPGRKYTREGMIRRVMAERRQKAENAPYKIVFADNIYGEHVLYNEKGVKHQVTLRDFETETGYIDSPDLRANKLGTTKHLMFAFKKLKGNKRLYNKLSKQYPFVEIFLDPLNDYRITWFYPHELPEDLAPLIKKYFKKKSYIPESSVKKFLGFLQKAENLEGIKIRPEVWEKVEAVYSEAMLEKLQKKYKPDYTAIKAKLFPYQKKGVEFVLFKEGAIIADDMGLGKTLQAITAAVFKKEVFGFKKTLIVCPSSLKQQWKSEIEKFTNEKALIIEGFQKERIESYRDGAHFFYIANYECILRDFTLMNRYPFDFIILDEAQRIKNYNTKTAHAVKQLQRKHSLVITGTPIENHLVDLYSIVQFVDPYFLAPLWEFSYQHCYFDTASDNQISGYYDLLKLKNKMKKILIRREKRTVLKELPNICQLDVPVRLHPNQADLHTGFAKGIAQILTKKFKTPFDMQRLMLLLTNMRMVCNSTFLIDKTSNDSSKLVELKYILTEKLDVKNSGKKIIIFSEWLHSLQLIANLLKELDIGYTQLSGKIPVKKRTALIKKFAEDDQCQVFLSTEAGGSGLNLQMADTVINFELPWNPAKKNQRIGRIDRLGQTAKKLLVINLIARASIEEKIASGLMLKQNLFEGVLNEENPLDDVDFSQKGRSQFLKQLEAIIEELEWPDISDAEEEELTGIAESVSDDHVLEEDEPAAPTDSERLEKLEQMEAVMNQGMSFLAGLYKMSTGKDMSTSDNKVEIDKATGEVVMRFKLGI